MRTSTFTLILASTLMLAVAPRLARSESPTTRPAPTTQPNPWKAWDPAVMAEDQKKKLEASDDEWGIIQRHMKKISSLRSELLGTVAVDPNKDKPKDEPDPKDPNVKVVPVRTVSWTYNEIGQATQDLWLLLRDKEAKPDEFKATINTLRTTRQKVQAQIKKEQQTLRELVNTRQEGYLIVWGYLD